MDAVIKAAAAAAGETTDATGGIATTGASGVAPGGSGVLGDSNHLCGWCGSYRSVHFWKNCGRIIQERLGPPH